MASPSPVVETCTLCGTALTSGNHAVGARKCTECASGNLVPPDMNAVFKSFEAHPEISEKSIEARGIVDSAPRLIVGVLILSVTTYLGSMIAGAQNARWGGVGGWVVGMLAVTAVIFAGAHPLDLRRWKRFWRGDLFGFMIVQFGGTFYAIDHFQQRMRTDSLAVPPSASELARVDLMIYGAACVAGLITGFIWIAVRDGRDKGDLAVMYREWMRRQGRGASVGLPPLGPPGGR